ncbi:MAG: ATP-binding protein [Kiritimatiellia bacterium]
MLISFSVENFRSFKERQSFVMEATSDKHLRESHVCENRHPAVLKTAAVYGSNASGKSNLMQAMIWMRNLVQQSVTDRIGENRINPEPFRLQTDYVNRPTVMEVEFFHGVHRYRYGFALTAKEVVEEWLFRKGVAGAPARVFTRQDGKISPNRNLMGSISDVVKRTRPDVLFLRSCAEWNESISEDVQKWFEQFRHVSGVSDRGFVGFTASRIQDETERERILRFVQKADFSISGIRAELKMFTEDDFPKEIPKELRRQALSMSSQLPPRILTLHPVYDAEGKQVAEEEFDLATDESEGTRKFLALAGPVLHTLEQGAILVVDEFEARLHPNLTKALLSWFHGPANTKNAQLILATHDTGLMEPELLRRDQIWFCEKDNVGSTRLYSLAEFDPQLVRNSTKFNRQYLMGIFGAVPHVALEEFLP